MRRYLLLLALLATACREGPAPFAIEDPAAQDSSGRLTFNVRGDHAPVWNKNSDSLYYGAYSYPSLPDTKGILLAIPRTGGVVKMIMPQIQVGVQRKPWLSAPALSPDGGSLAFFELTDVRDHEFDRVVCSNPPPAPQYDTLGTNSSLQEAVLRVRKVNATGATDDAQLTVKFAGRTPGAFPGVVINIAYPFHRLFEGEGVPIYRASWSPDGRRLVFSDGLKLYIWTVGQASAVQLPGTDDGILPAWSPDGTLIAFTKPLRGATQTFGCRGLNDGAVLPAGFFTRTVYTPLTRETSLLILIKPDGTGLQILGVGDAPAWTPDSKTIVAHRDENLVSISINTGASTIISNTKNAFEPAISRDGRFIAFARRTEIGTGPGEPLSKGKYNIWVAPF